ncbi:MAG TPA: hypothetical protein VFK52_04005 [Nocardioidaceae bacterium]|nr:hypothetical protein [Nocardioidaceae bacterium]
MFAKKRLLALLVGLLGIALAVPAAGPALAAGPYIDTKTVNGSMAAGGPTMPVLFIDGSNDLCTGQGSAAVLYHSTTVKALANGTHTVTLTSPADYASIYVFKDTFDPVAPGGVCLVADNSVDNVEDGSMTVTWEATQGTTYFVVVFDDTFDQVGGPFTWVMQSPTPPGAAITAASGPGKRFVKMPDKVRCDLKSAVATWKRPAGKVVKAVFKANFKVVARPTRIRPGKAVVLKGIPKTATKLTATLTLKSGAKVNVSRKYLACG